MTYLKKYFNQLLLTVLIVGLGVSLPAQGDMEFTDATISANVESELYFQIDVPANRIDVDADNGIITLTGTVGNILAKERAEKVAMANKGVRAVVNRIQVDPVARQDDELGQDVMDAILADPATEMTDIDILVDDGVVTLTGTTQSWQEMKLAAHVAKGVRGVKAIENELEIEYKEERDDYEIKSEIEQAILNDIRLYPKMIKVSVDDGIVGLSGTVGNLNEKQLAESYAWTSGVLDVNSSALHIHDWAEKDHIRKSVYSPRSDQEIKEAVVAAFRYDPRVVSMNPEVNVKEGVVTLSGTVTNIRAKRSAADDARNVVGVAYVKNNLKVRPDYVPSNEVLTTRVENSLRRDPDVQNFEITVESWDGTVYLTGQVDSQFEKEKAQMIASTVDGAVVVKNYLTVREESGPTVYFPYSYNYFPSPFVSAREYYNQQLTDEQIEASIEDELWWSPIIDSESIQVSVEQGIATLTGKVGSWYERDAVVENALEGGADSVIDKLSVQMELN